ncbi:putative glutaredoxin, Thioredoxin-like superfamily [Helianthus annuus]|nr:putative glutaredoxin, Thioredoxin-like superfamily [Helianthus annuus]
MQSYLSCKTWCGYYKSVKKLFSELNVSYKVIELDEETIMEKHRAGKLVPLLTEAGAIANASAQL